uniref:Uncharacterized protein n=1 Tax=Ditylenchus dipsaci TaxID=166011 RepID=A0A915E7Z2_9BILA
MAVNNSLAIKTTSEQFLNFLPDILAFYTCWQLENIIMTTKITSQMATDILCNKPPRQIFSLSLIIDKEMVKCFVQKSMEDPKQEISTDKFLKSFGEDKNIRSQSTEIAFKFDCYAMQQFKESYLEINHLWKSQHLTIVINPCVNKKDIVFFQKMFLFESGLTQEAISLLIKDNTDSYPYLNPFEHGDLKECKNLTIYAPDAVFDSQEVVAFLHDNDNSTSEYTTEKELCFAFRENNEQYDVVYGLIRQLIQVS